MKQTFMHKMKVLWKEFLPLSVSDVTMACGDPMVNATLAQMPFVAINLAALAIVKSIAVLFESPIIMMLHASSALSDDKKARKALWKFALIACVSLTIFLSVLAIPSIFFPFLQTLIGIQDDVAISAHKILLCLLLWPASIAIRRYFQGILIIHGQLKLIARAGFLRLCVLFLCLVVGYFSNISASYLVGGSLMIAVFSESLAIFLYAQKYKHIFTERMNRDPAVTPQDDNVAPCNKHAVAQEAYTKPHSLKDVWKFYWPLAHSMILVWGGRALLIVCVAKSFDSRMSLAIWPITWALVLLFANATRMVQQVTIRNKDRFHPFELIVFSFSVGACFSSLLVFLNFSPFASQLLALFVGQQAIFLENVQKILLICLCVPVLVSIQNVLQGFLMCMGKTHVINRATLSGTGVLLICAYWGVAHNFSGASVAAYSMLISLTVEIVFLISKIPWKSYVQSYLEQQNINKRKISYEILS